MVNCGKLIPFIAETLNFYYEMKTGTNIRIFNYNEKGKIIKNDIQHKQSSE